MKFKLLIQPDKEEIVQAQLHEVSKFSKQLEEFVVSNGSISSLVGFDADKEIVYLNFVDIAIIGVIEGKTYAITNDNRQYLLKRRLYQVAEKLPDYFLKINKSSIVNRHQIKKFTVNSGAGINVIMKNNVTDYVSRRCFAKIRKEL
ncbi:LytTR family DNA-binding domain-containing protein [Lactobacillus sp.]|uniref:LytTR family DNA-binding domain-containing protein n=1 Tax=Lactobacillus sp. TaxID=1591 RepID=UPI0019A98575|nr:LytTR family DNA-binding domain-containing protein [Lactobacillus sp.]MBD5429985.1 LytTR family transcriptional regulator [Lactobacillus sp.]